MARPPGLCNRAYISISLAHGPLLLGSGGGYVEWSSKQGLSEHGKRDGAILGVRGSGMGNADALGVGAVGVGAVGVGMGAVGVGAVGVGVGAVGDD